MAILLKHPEREITYIAVAYRFNGPPSVTPFHTECEARQHLLRGEELGIREPIAIVDWETKRIVKKFRPMCDEQIIDLMTFPL